MPNLKACGPIFHRDSEFTLVIDKKISLISYSILKGYPILWGLLHIHQVIFFWNQAMYKIFFREYRLTVTGTALSTSSISDRDMTAGEKLRPASSNVLTG